MSVYLDHAATTPLRPEARDAWLAAGGARIRHVDIAGGNHYLAGQPALVEQVADEMSAWMHAL